MPTVPIYDFDTDFALKVRQTIRVVQSDIGREFVCHAKFNGQAWDLTGFTGTVLGVKPDGNATDTTATIDEDEFKFTLTEQMAAVAGAYEIFLTVENGSDVKIQAPVLLCVLEGADGVISESALGALTELLQASQEALEDASDAATAAAASAASAAESAENAFSGTPEGYAALVNKVNTLNSNQTGFLSYELEQGTYSDSANWPSKVSNTKRVRFKDLVAVPSMNFHVTIPEGFKLCWFSYDKDFNFVEERYFYASGEWSFQLSKNGIYVACCFKKDDETAVTPSEVTGFRIKEVPPVETYSAYEFTQLGGTVPTAYGRVICLSAARPWLKRIVDGYFLYIASSGLAIYRGYIATNDTTITWRND